jgi:hypothetical protein
MSYCRAGNDSDAYVYRSGTCWCIHIVGEYDGDYFPKTFKEFYDKMHELRDLGVKIPEYAFDRLEREYEEGYE